MTTTDDPIAQAALCDICENQADDAPRLMYADWLEEHGGEERAEFIRVQCELARPCLYPLGPSCVRCLERRHRESALWTDTLTTEIGQGLPAKWTLTRDLPCRTPHAIVRRGFVDEIGCYLSGWRRDGADVVRRHPVQTVSIADLTPRTSTIPSRIIHGVPHITWTWWREGNGPYTENRLPLWLWEYVLPRDAKYPVDWEYITVWNHETREKALAALSAVLIGWARGTPRESVKW